MKTIKIIINIIGLLIGLVFLLQGGTDIQLGFGIVIMLISINYLM